MTELKQFNGAASQVCNNAGLWSPINSILQGTGADNRIGREITLGPLRGRFRVTASGTTVSSPVGLRFILLYDKHCNATLGSSPFLISDLLVSNTPGTAQPEAGFVITNADRFVVLYDRYWVAPAFEFTGGAFIPRMGPTSQDTFAFDFAVDATGLPCVYGNVLGAPPITGALFCVFVGNSTVGAEKYTVTGAVDVLFVDN